VLLTDPRIAVLALGRFGSGGMVTVLILDLVIVYDAVPHLLVRDLTQEEAYARLTEYFVTTLSSITREGLLYRVDLRLRPDGQKGRWQPVPRRSSPTLKSGRDLGVACVR